MSTPKPKLSILYTTPNLETAGSGPALLRLASSLDPTRFTAAVCVGERRGVPLETRFDDAGIQIIEAATTVDPRPIAGLRRRARDAASRVLGRADIWHSFNYLDDYTEPMVAHAAGAHWVYTKKNMSWNRRSWLARSHLAARIVAQNQDMLDTFFTMPTLSRRAVLIPRGTNPSPQLPDRSRARAALRLAGDARIILSLAHVIPRKRQHVLVRAASNLPGVHLLLAGRLSDTQYVAHVRVLVAELGMEDRVHLVGHRADVSEVLAAADTFCLPTSEDAEGCPVALLEAMAAGLPPVVSDVPGSRDVVVDGRSGFVVPPDDPVALANALSTLSDPSLRLTIGTNARQRILDRFSADAETRAHELLYEELASRRRPVRNRKQRLASASHEQG